MSHRNTLKTPTGSQAQRDGNLSQRWVSHSTSDKLFVSLIFEMAFATKRKKIVDYIPHSKLLFSVFPILLLSPKKLKKRGQGMPEASRSVT